MEPKDGFRMSYIQLNDDPPQNSRETRPHPQSSAEQAFLRSQNRAFWGTSWTLEIGACFISIITVVSISVVLLRYDGKSIPEWPHGITLNTLVSVLSTIMKAQVTFIVMESLAQLKWSWFHGGNKLSDLARLDAASRGALGAMNVLIRFVPRHLISFGCLILVLGTVTDPFVQQVMSTVSRPVNLRHSTFIQTCNTSLYTDYSEGSGPGMNKAPLSTLGAIYSGIFQEQGTNSKNTLFNCPTGNCTFSPYQTLGYCSRCANITDSLTLTKTVVVPTIPQEDIYNYTLPNNFTFSTSMNSIYLMNATTDESLELVKLDTTDITPIINFTAITAAGYGVPPRISATECTLYFCVQTYNSSVSNGQLSENIISTKATTNASYSAFSEENFAITPEKCYTNGTVYDDPSKYPKKCVYNVNWLSRLAMSNSLDSLLKGTGSLFVSNRPRWDSDTLEALYGLYGNYTDINLVFQSLASSLTVNARSNVCTSDVRGKAWSVESFVRVRWGWFILPIIVVVLSVIFLMVTIAHTRNQYIWKSSPLALLFSGLMVEVPSPIKAHPTVRGMEEISRKLNIVLESSHDGVKLKAVPT
ncbi:hypothetical protein N7495_000332 [Penicillium taxi]|uniref:uncharacterized protein n=1 Tax=Penicillium taxi TaxID=168475 RepID=UPI00254569B8|nr:uncharacterized protein N7495_000332 [Penicillium taxi]KAJ5907650.1 hypothetical protein N7495_000332 [Penicillium taxi]